MNLDHFNAGRFSYFIHDLLDLKTIPTKAINSQHG